MKIKLISLILILCCFISVSGWADFWMGYFDFPGQPSYEERESYKEKCQSSVLEGVKCYVNSSIFRVVAISVLCWALFCIVIMPFVGNMEIEQARQNPGNASPVETKACGDATLSR
jgi:hypothetical protein